jgi:hypothetical protein
LQWKLSFVFDSKLPAARRLLQNMREAAIAAGRTAEESPE